MDKEQAARIINDSYNGAKRIKGTGAELTPSELQAITCLAFIPCEGSDPITAAFIAAFHAGFSRGIMMACIQNVYNMETKCIPNITEHNITEHNITRTLLKDHVRFADGSAGQKTEPDQNVEEDQTPDDEEEIGQSERLEQLFNEVWKIYPRKEHKQKAKQLFYKLNPTDYVIAKIVNTIIAFNNSKWNNGYGIPLFENWLLDQRWNDEPMT